MDERIGVEIGAEQRPDVRDAAKDAQLSFRWKAGYREQWQPALESWAERQPKGQQSAQDFIIYLLRQAGRAGESAAIRARFDALNLKGLADAHYGRRAAEDRMLEMIADLIAGARDQAESEVKAEMDRLKETAKFAQAQAKKTEDREAEKEATLKQEIEKLKAESEAQRVAAEKTLAELKETQAELSEAKAEVTQLTGEVVSIQTDMDEVKDQAAELAKNFEAAKLEILNEKEKRIAAEQEKAETEIASKNQQAEIDRLKTAFNDLEQRAKAEQERAAVQIAELSKKLADTEQAADENWQEVEKIDKELQDARIRIASLEGELKAAGMNGKALSDAIAVIASMKRTKLPETPEEGQES